MAYGLLATLNLFLQFEFCLTCCVFSKKLGKSFLHTL